MQTERSSNSENLEIVKETENVCKVTTEKPVIYRTSGQADHSYSRNIQFSVEQIEVTSRVFATVFTLVRGNTPLNQLGNFIELQERNGVNMGTRLRDRMAASRIVQSISEDLHENLKEEMIINNSSFSMLIDASIDVSGRHYLSVILRYLTDDIQPAVVLYRLIEIGGRSRGEDIWKKFLEELKKDGNTFKEYLLNNIVSIGSDAGGNLYSSNVGFISYLEQHVERRVIKIHCIAHRVELAVTHAVREFPYLRRIENMLNSVYSFYHDSYKRNHNLAERARSMNRNFKALSRIIEVRWVSSELRAIDNFLNDYYVIVTDLHELAYSKETTLNARNTAEKLFEGIRGKGFLLLLNMWKVLLTKFKKWSLQSQLRDSSIIDQYEIRNELINELNDFSWDEELGFFLERTTAHGSSSPISSLQNYEAGPFLYHDHVLLNNDFEQNTLGLGSDAYPSFQVEKDKIIEKLT